jgi:hypothetical protein
MADEGGCVWKAPVQSAAARAIRTPSEYEPPAPPSAPPRLLHGTAAELTEHDNHHDRQHHGGNDLQHQRLLGSQVGEASEGDEDEAEHQPVALHPLIADVADLGPLGVERGFGDLLFVVFVDFLRVVFDLFQVV